MKKNNELISLTLFSILLGISVMLFNPVFATEVSSEDSDFKVDKLQSSTGMKVKHSGIAQAMENATYNATHKGEKKKEVNFNPYAAPKEQKETKRRDTSTFKWY